MMRMDIRALDDTFRDAVDGYVRCLWGGPMCAAMGALYDTRELPGFVAVEEGALLGALLYREAGGGMEVSALFSLVEGQGAGQKLLDAAAAEAKRQNLKRLWLITTNDNTRAIRFYQRYGFRLKAVHIGAVNEARKLKPSIPPTGDDGIPIEHEFEFEITL
jgi:ribosomal protein S18 acetylase RimI-like enzyme